MRNLSQGPHSGNRKLRTAASGEGLDPQVAEIDFGGPVELEGDAAGGGAVMLAIDRELVVDPETDVLAVGFDGVGVPVGAAVALLHKGGVGADEDLFIEAQLADGVGE